ncbi:unnamed protein product [Choristocarpus tenellus]
MDQKGFQLTSMVPTSNKAMISGEGGHTDDIQQALRRRANACVDLSKASGFTSEYECLLSAIISSKCVAGVALLDNQGRSLFQMTKPPFKSVLVLPDEGTALVGAVQGLSDDGLCRQDSLLCTGQRFRVFGSTPCGVYAVGPARRSGVIIRAFPGARVLIVVYRWPFFAQQVIPFVEGFIDEQWAVWEGDRNRTWKMNVQMAALDPSR